MNLRYHAAMRATARYLRQGHPIYSPITHCHCLPGMEAQRGDLSFWLPHCLSMLRCAQEMWVLTLDGWQESTGVAGEIKAAHEWSIPVLLKEPQNG